MRGLARIIPTILAACSILDRASAQTPTDNADREIGNCILVSEITRSQILNDLTIRLEMRDGPALLMRLEAPCPQLRFHDYFSYEPTFGQLCAAIDHIVTRAGDSCAIAGFSQAPAPETSEAGDGEP